MDHRYEADFGGDKAREGLFPVRFRLSRWRGAITGPACLAAAQVRPQGLRQPLFTHFSGRQPFPGGFLRLFGWILRHSCLCRA
jgi:hypothetical protein